MSVHRRGAGWRVRYRDGDRNRSRTFDRKRDADAFDAEVRRRRALGTVGLVAAGRTTLGDFVRETWWPAYSRGVTLRTQENTRGLWERHVEPELGGAQLHALTPARLREWQSALDRSGVGRYTVNRALVLAGQVLQRAAEDGLLSANPAHLVRKLPGAPRRTVDPPSPATVEAIRRALLAPVQVGASAEGRRPRAAYSAPDALPEVHRRRDAVLVAVLAYAGLRPGEALALRWSDVRERTLLVERATDGRGSTKGTKTGATRAVRLLEPLRDDLRAWRLASSASRLADLIFPGRDGELVDGDTWKRWTSGRWRAACRSVGLDPLPRPYDLRHACASLLLAEGRTVHYVAGQMGHDAALTLSTYGHVMAELEDAPTVDATALIRAARDGSRSLPVPTAAGTTAA